MLVHQLPAVICGREMKVEISAGYFYVLEVNSEKCKYTVVLRDQHARQNHSIKIGNK